VGRNVLHFLGLFEPTSLQPAAGRICFSAGVCLQHCTTYWLVFIAPKLQSLPYDCPILLGTPPPHPPKLAPNFSPTASLQVHLTYVNPSTVVVSWATGAGTTVDGPLAVGNVNNTYGQYSTVDTKPDTNKYPVRYGTAAADLSMTAYGDQTTYDQIYTGAMSPPFGLDETPSPGHSPQAALCLSPCTVSGGGAGSR